MQLNAASPSLYPQQARRLSLMCLAAVMYMWLHGDGEAVQMAVGTTKLNDTNLQSH